MNTNAEKASNSPDSHSKKNIVFGMVLGYVSLFLSAISGLLFTPWIKETIGSSSYGLYSLSSSIINLFMLDLGLGATVNTFLSRYLSEGKKNEIQHFLSIVYKLYFLVDLFIFIAFVIYYFLIDSIYIGLTVDERTSFKVVFLISAAYSLVHFPSTILDGILNAYEEFIFNKIMDISYRILYIGLTVAAIILHLGLFSLVIAQSIAGLICIGSKIVYVHYHIHLEKGESVKLSWSEIKPILGFSIWAGFLTLFERLFTTIDPSILGVVSDSTNIAIFSVACTLEGIVYSLSSVISGFFLPKISRIYSSQDGEEMKAKNLTNLAIRVGKIQLILLTLIFGGFLCCGDQFIVFWMHEDATYSPVYLGTIFLMIPKFVLVPQAIFSGSMYVEKKLKHHAISRIIGGFVNVGLSFLFSYFYGAIGACLAICISMVVRDAIANVYYVHDLHVNLLSFFKETYPRVLLSGLIMVGIGLLLRYTLPFSLGITFAIEVVSMTVVYLVLTPFLSMSKTDRLFFKDLFKTVTKKH